MKKATILGAIAGDVVGSIYEFDAHKSKDFPLINKRMEFTDDTVMTLAVTDWLLHCPCHDGQSLTKRMRHWGGKYRWPMGSYGGMFGTWLDNDSMTAYGSWGNGSAMRVGAVGFYCCSLSDTLSVARTTAEVTHNHIDGIVGAQATAAAVFMAHTGKSKQEIRDYVTQQFGYDLNRTCDDIRPGYRFDGSCRGTVPESIIAFLDSTSYEDAIRLTVSLGGDADTMGAITGAIAAAYYGEMPDELYDFVLSRLPSDLKAIALEAEAKFQK